METQSFMTESDRQFATEKDENNVYRVKCNNNSTMSIIIKRTIGKN